MVESIARRLFILPQLPGDLVPTVTQSIGTASRDYSTITAWEADLDNGGIYSSGDDAVGECYNDSAFDEFVTINGGGTVGLNSVKLTVPSAERHDGTAGTGARNVRTGNLAFLATVACTIEWLEIDMGQTYGLTVVDFRSGGTAGNLLVHGLGNSSGNHNNAIANLSTGTVDFINCMVYDVYNATSNKWSRSYLKASSGGTDCYNCTSHDVVADTTGQAHGYYSITTATNCIGTDTGGTASTTNDFTSIGTPSYNLSSDATASGTGSLTNKAAADQFVSTSPVDLHLKSGADAIDAGTDLGTTPTGVNIDIDGRDRDAEGDTWDIGAHEFVAAAGGGGAVVGLATETDSALAIAAAKTRSIGLATETDTARGLTAAKRKTIGIATETASALALSVGKQQAIGRSTETDTALPVSAGASTPIGRATETDVALSVTARKTKAVGRATETDTALPVNRSKRRAIGRAVENDLALPLSVAKRLAIGLAAETDSALPVSGATPNPELVSIEFAFARRTVGFSLAQRSIDFSLAQRSIDFALN